MVMLRIVKSCDGLACFLELRELILCCFCLYQSHCENNSLSCEDCTSLKTFSTPTPTPSYGTFTTMPFSTLMPEGTCDRAMDLAFLLDGSEALSEDEFQATKEFILGVVERFRMGSAHTRATVLLYHSGVKTYDLQVYSIQCTILTQQT